MGKGKVSIKDSTPTQLPHDGPINTFFFSNTEPSSEAFLPESVALLVNNTSSQKNEPLDDGVVVVKQCITSLKESKQLKEQLLLLHDLKSQVIRKQRKDDDISNNKEFAALYRLLMEWAWSFQTPFPLRRAIQSLLIVLADSDRITVRQHDVEAIHQSVLQSILQSLSSARETSCWRQPVRSLHDFVSWDPLLDAVVQNWINVVQSLRDAAQAIRQDLGLEHDTNKTGAVLLQQIDHAMVLVDTIKIVFGLSTSASNMKEDPTVLKGTLYRPLLSFLFHLLQSRAVQANSLSIVSIAYSRVLLMMHGEQNIVLDSDMESSLSERARCALWQGLAASVPWNQVKRKDASVLEYLLNSLETIARQSADTETRLTAFKGLRGLLSRCCQNNTSLSRESQTRLLNLVIESWEHPPNSKVAQAIAAVFENLVSIMNKDETAKLTDVVDRILKQPRGRKGKYLALDTLVSAVGPSGIEQSMGIGVLLDELLEGVGDIGQHTGVIAGVWSKLLTKRLEELLASDEGASTSLRDDTCDLPQTWLDLWTPSLAKALVKGTMRRRKQLAAFCLPCISPAIGKVTTVKKSGRAFARLLREIGELKGIHNEERIQWALLGVVRACTSQSWYDLSDPAMNELGKAVKEATSLDDLRSSLASSSLAIRVAAVTSMADIVDTYYPRSGRVRVLAAIYLERDLWKFFLPLAVHEEAGNISAILLRLLSFVDDFLVAETSQTAITSRELPESFDFLSNFLLGDVLSMLGYPGAPPRKLSFLLSMLESLLVYVTQDLGIHVESKIFPKSTSFLGRKRGLAESKTLTLVRRKILGDDVQPALFAALHTPWESLRTDTFALWYTFIQVAHMECVPAAAALQDQCDDFTLSAYGLSLASSPRPRVADTGSRLLSLMCTSFSKLEDKMHFVQRYVSILNHRLESMKNLLLCQNQSSSDEIEIAIPVAHGIVHFLRLAIDHEKNLVSQDASGQSIFDSLGSACKRALQISLSIVADVEEGTMVDGLDGDFAVVNEQRVKRVNPGSIGANGIFSSVQRVTDKESQRRLASQRLIVCTWLLLKETCGLTASLVTVTPKVDHVLAEQAGTLLISTLTSVKHVGAAFSARDAFERIVQKSFEDGENLASLFARKLIDEVANVDRVRDSTLRRSTGYALGFLSIVKSETIAMKRSVYPLSRAILSQIVQMALPQLTDFESFMSKIGLDDGKSDFSLLSDTCHNSMSSLSRNADYDFRSRVHALNVLRMLVLDAPYFEIVGPFVGDALVLSTIGYTDQEWAVRNSSTMVFSAVMLRAIDADKNAATSDKENRTTASFSEFFRRHKRLPTFLGCVLKAGMNGEISSAHHMSLPPILPILVLLSRFQPVWQSGAETVTLVEPFFKSAVRCLGSKELSIRTAAAKALANMTSDDKNSVTYARSLMERQVSFLASVFEAYEKKVDCNWNEVHGALLSIRALLRVSARQRRLRDILVDFPLLDANNGCILRLPPCCIEVVVDILELLEWDTLEMLATYELVSEWIVRVESCCPHTVGLADLGLHIARNATQRMACLIWQEEATEDSRAALISRISRFFSSPCQELRMASVKAFKKTIYEGLDCIPSEKFLVALSETFCAALYTELFSHGGSSTTAWKNNSIHSPTIRRLSRCLLECLHSAMSRKQLPSVLKAIGPSLKQCLSEAPLFQYSELFRGEEDSWTVLAGNYVELLSFLPFTTQIVPLIRRISNPYCPWRLRHSAAVATVRLFETSPEALFETWLTFVEDEDPDVRTAVVGTATRPDCALESFFSETTIPGSHILVRLLRKLTNSNYGKHDNDKNNEKVFVVEDPNAYQETVLLFQHSVGATLRQPYTPLSVSDVALLEEIYEDAKAFVASLSAQTSVLLNETRQSRVFIPLHCLLVAFATVTYRYGDVVTWFRHQLKALDSCSQGLHPLIRQALNVAQTAAQGSDVTFKGLRNCLFLGKTFEQ